MAKEPKIGSFLSYRLLMAALDQKQMRKLTA
jgi:hypothetical protein